MNVHWIEITSEVLPYSLGETVIQGPAFISFKLWLQIHLRESVPKLPSQRWIFCYKPLNKPITCQSGILKPPLQGWCKQTYLRTIGLFPFQRKNNSCPKVNNLSEDRGSTNSPEENEHGLNLHSTLEGPPPLRSSPHLHLYLCLHFRRISTTSLIR